MLTNYIKIAWKVLLRHPFYTFITLFGISLTLTVLMVITSFLDHLIGVHYPENKRARSLYVFNMSMQSTREHNFRGGGGASYSFIKNYVKTLKTPESVGVATTMAFNAVNMYVNGKRMKLATKYTDAEFWKVTDFIFLEGKPYDQRNIANGDHVVVVTDDFKRQYFGESSGPVTGKEINIENILYRIIGVVKGSPVTRPFTYSELYFPYTDPKSDYRTAGYMGRYIAIILAARKDDIPAIKQEFDSAVKKIPLPIVDGDVKFDILEIKADNQLDGFMKMILRTDSELRQTIFYTVVGIIMLMLMGLPIINLVNVNVSRIIERSSEIGIRKAFGAPSRTLLWQFIAENIFITFIGCGIALILSAIIIYIINTSGMIANSDLTINFNVFMFSVLICFVFGFLSGVLPALRMSKLKIVDALKG